MRSAQFVLVIDSGNRPGGGLLVLFLQGGEERWPPPQLSREGFDRAQSRRADVVFHAFDVVMNNLLVQTEQSEKVGQQLVPPGDVARERLARSGQNQSTILLVFEQSFRRKALHHVADAGLGNLQARGDIHDARIALRIYQFKDAFEIIFDRGGAAGGGSFGRHGLERY